MLEVANEDYIRTAWAKGASERRVVVHHILRNSMLPVITMLGLNIAYMLSTVVFIERVFNLPGLGVEMLNAAYRSDVPVVVGIVVFNHTHGDHRQLRRGRCLRFPRSSNQTGLRNLANS
jgi:peptide/nickel transport system permease protein